MKGFFNTLLSIDAGQSQSRVEPLENELLAGFLGGKGLGTQLLLTHNPSGVDPLSPDNRFIITLGPATDSPVYGSCRYGIFSKSPLTGFYAESYSGGKAAVTMSRAGFDAVVIKGAAPSPVWIEISDQGVVFHDATDLWGMDTYKAEDEIKARCGVKGATALVIGPAGENLVKFAVVENDYWRSAGRTGMGAVLGSKNIKGIIFHGKTRREFHDLAGIKAYGKDMLSRLKDSPVTHVYREQGTPVMVAGLNNAGAFPTKYWSKGKFDGWEKINAQAMKEKLDVKPRSCKTCFMGCGKLVTVQEGPHKGLKMEGPEYETLYAFGGLCLIDSIEDIVWLNDICDSLGMDTITAGNLAAMTLEAATRGLIKEPYSYGDAQGVADILFKTARREGLGGLLADGIRLAAKEMGMADQAVHVKGLEPAGYDPRVLKGMGLAYAVSPRGACHLRSTFYKPELSGIIDPDQLEGKAELFLDFEDRCTLFDTFILCRFYRDFYPWEDLITLVELTTGMKMDQPQLAQLAARVTDATRIFNLQEGLTRDHDTLPDRMFKEKLEGGKGISRADLNYLVQDYYRLRGWDEYGVPG